MSWLVQEFQVYPRKVQSKTKLKILWWNTTVVGQDGNNTNISWKKCTILTYMYIYYEMITTLLLQYNLYSAKCQCMRKNHGNVEYTLGKKIIFKNVLCLFMFFLVKLLHNQNLVHTYVTTINSKYPICSAYLKIENGEK